MPAPPLPADPGRILIIRPSALGDVARTAPSLASLRRAYPRATIDWLVDRRFADAVRAHPALDGVVPFDRHRKATVPGLLARLARARYDLVFDLQGLARSGVFARATRAGARVGYANARELAHLAYTHRHRIDRNRHGADRMLSLVEAAGVARVSDFGLRVPEGDGGFTAAFVKLHNHALQWYPPDAAVRFDERFVCVAPTARWGCKRWPIERYAQLIERILSHNLATWVAVVAAPHERHSLIDAVAKTLPLEPHNRVGFPATTVGQMMALIRGARLVVCNDSAALHLAVGLGTPTVSLFGPTDPALVGPPPADLFPDLPGSELHGRGLHRVLRSPSAEGRNIKYRRQHDDDRLISEIDLETVWAAVQAALAVPT